MCTINRSLTHRKLSDIWLTFRPKSHKDGVLPSWNSTYVSQCRVQSNFQHFLFTLQLIISLSLNDYREFPKIYWYFEDIYQCTSSDFYNSFKEMIRSILNFLPVLIFKHKENYHKLGITLSSGLDAYFFLH